MVEVRRRRRGGKAAATAAAVFSLVKEEEERLEEEELVEEEREMGLGVLRVGVFLGSILSRLRVRRVFCRRRRGPRRRPRGLFEASHP